MALELDTSGDQIDHGDIAEFDAPSVLTFMFWAERSVETTANLPFMQKAPTGAMWLYRSSASANNFTVGQQGISEKVSAAEAFPVDDWTHLGFVFDNTATPKLTLKVNGVNSGSGDDVTSLGDGGVNPFLVQWVNGIMRFAHLKAWAAALTDEEFLTEKGVGPVQRSANNILACAYDTLAATDLSPSGYHGTHTGAVVVAGPSFPVDPTPNLAQRTRQMSPLLAQ